MKDKKTVSGTREWASSNANVMLGCKHDCRYCFARSSAARFGRKDPELWPIEVVQSNLADRRFGKRKGTVMFPTTHDITPDNLEYTGAILHRLLEAGNDVLVVSKPHLSVITTLCKDLEAYKDQLLFRFSIGSVDNEVLTLWEPGAPDYEERRESLKHVFNAGFRTSVSMEPILDTTESHILQTFNDLESFVTDAIWLGKMNKAVERLKRNGFGDNEPLMTAAAELVESQSDERITALYAKLKDEPKVKWKESIKKVVGIAVPTEAGLDV